MLTLEHTTPLINDLISNRSNCEKELQKLQDLFPELFLEDGSLCKPSKVVKPNTEFIWTHQMIEIYGRACKWSAKIESINETIINLTRHLETPTQTL